MSEEYDPLTEDLIEHFRNICETGCNSACMAIEAADIMRAWNDLGLKPRRQEFHRYAFVCPGQSPPEAGPPSAANRPPP